ncbi:MAG: LysR substrate-binding domain-containing protein [Spirochaetales bacterium]
MIEREHLEIMQALARQGTLTRAAEELHLTQSALSHAIRRLEEQAGVALWQRDGRRLRLTQAGEYLRGLAARVVPQLAEADGALADYARGDRGRLRIGMECHPCYEWLLTRLPAFLETHPQVEVDVIQRFQFSGLDALVNHEIDLLITPDPVTTDGVTFKPVFGYELLLIASHGVVPHSASAGESVEAELFTSLDLLTYPVPRDRLDLFTRLLIPAGVEPRSVRAVEATEVMLALVRAGRGVTAIPDWLVPRLGNEVRAYRLGREGVHKELSVGVRDGDAEVPYIEAWTEQTR